MNNGIKEETKALDSVIRAMANEQRELKETYETYCRVEDELIDTVAEAQTIELNTEPFSGKLGHEVGAAIETLEEARKQVTEERIKLKNENKEILLEKD